MEREILFCITAFQMGVVSASQLREIGKDLSEKKINSLRAELIKRAAIPPEKVRSIEQAIDISASIHNHDYKKILSLRVYRRLMREAFGDSIRIESGEPQYPSRPRLQIDGDVEDIHTVTEEAMDRYTILREIGSGGIGRVLLSFDRHIGRNIAIKELLGGRDVAHEGSTLSVDEARFLREARLTAQLEHPSIVPVYEIGRRLNGSIYYTMRYVRGRTLSEIIKGCSHLGERLKYLSHFVNLCNAIAYAHSKGVLHRDIKPQNVMIGEFGETVVLDWGLAKIKDSRDITDERFEYQMRLLRDALAGMTISGEVMGTPQYMPPEQAFGYVEEIDERSDIYSLGAVLYEILTGFPPFNEDTPINTVYAVRKYFMGERRLIAVREEEPECPEELATIAEKALSPRKEDRYQSVVDLVDDVEAYMSGRRVSGYRYTLFSYLRYLFKRGKAAFFFAFVLILISAISLFLLQNVRREFKESRLRLYENRAIDAIENNNPLLASYYAALAQDLDTKNRRLSHLLFEPFRDYPKNALRLNTIRVAGMDVSEDKKYLAVTTYEGLLQIYSLMDLGVLNSVELESPGRSVSFSPLSDRVAVGLTDGQVRVFGLQPFALIKQMKEFSTPVNSIAFSWGGKYMAVAAGGQYQRGRDCEDCTIKIYSAITFEPLIELKGHIRGVNHLVFTRYNRYLVSTSYDGNLIFWDVFNRREVYRLNTPSPVLALSYRSENEVIALLSDGSVITVSDTGRVNTLLMTPPEHYLFGVTENIISTAGGNYSDGECRRCGVYIYRKGENEPVVLNTGKRIDNLYITGDGDLMITADEKGWISIYDIHRILAQRNGVMTLYNLQEEPLSTNCKDRYRSCIIIDRGGNVLKISKDGVATLKGAIGDLFDIRAAYPLGIDDILIALSDGGLVRYRPSDKSREELLKGGFRVSLISGSIDNEFIGVLNRAGEFRLFSNKGGSILNTQQDRTDIVSFAFSDDNKYIVLVRRERLSFGNWAYNIVLEEILSDKKERILFTSESEIMHILALRDPFRVIFIDSGNNMYGIDRDGRLLFKRRIDSNYRVKKVISVPATPYLFLTFEDKRFAALYSLTEDRIAFYLFGSSDTIVDASILDRFIITISRDGEVIACDIPDIKETFERHINPDFVSHKMRYFEGLLKNLGIYYAKY